MAPLFAFACLRGGLASRTALLTVANRSDTSPFHAEARLRIVTLQRIKTSPTLREKPASTSTGDNLDPVHFAPERLANALEHSSFPFPAQLLLLLMITSGPLFLDTSATHVVVPPGRTRVRMTASLLSKAAQLSRRPIAPRSSNLSDVPWQTKQPARRGPKSLRRSAPSSLNVPAPICRQSRRLRRP